jgi:hypothetical protein
VINLNELRDGPLSAVPDDLVEAVLDNGIRFQAAARPSHYLAAFLKVARQVADTAPQDNSWGEAERGFVIMVRRMIVAERRWAELQVQVTALQNQVNGLQQQLDDGVPT